MTRPEKHLCHALDTLSPVLRVHWIGFDATRPDYGSAPIRVPEFGLVFVDKGRGWVKQAGRRETVEEGDIFIVFPHTWYSFAAVGGPWDVYWLSFTADGPGLQLLLRRAGITPRSFLRRGCDRARLREMFEGILWMAQNDAIGSIKVPAVTYALLDEMMNAATREQQAPSTGVSAARRYIDENPQAQLSIEHLAELAGLSRFHFMRAFKKEFGRAPVQYQISARMAAARELLAAGATVKETAYQVGYRDLFYFSRLFKSKIGVAPSAYAGQHPLPQRDRKSSAERM